MKVKSQEFSELDIAIGGCETCLFKKLEESKREKSLNISSVLSVCIIIIFIIYECFESNINE